MANETAYGRYIIKTEKTANEWRARAFRGKRYSEVLSGPTEQAAILATKAKLDADEAAQRALRGGDGYPTATEVRNALELISMSAGQRTMLMAHKSATEHIMTATELARAAGYESYEAANSQYGTLARALATEMGWQPPEQGGQVTWTFALATGADGNTRAEIEAAGLANWRWRMRPEVVEALAE